MNYFEPSAAGIQTSADVVHLDAMLHHLVAAARSARAAGRVMVELEEIDVEVRAEIDATIIKAEAAAARVVKLRRAAQGAHQRSDGTV